MSHAENAQDSDWFLKDSSSRFFFEQEQMHIDIAAEFESGQNGRKRKSSSSGMDRTRVQRVPRRILKGLHRSLQSRIVQNYSDKDDRYCPLGL